MDGNFKKVKDSNVSLILCDATGLLAVLQHLYSRVHCFFSNTLVKTLGWWWKGLQIAWRELCTNFNPSLMMISKHAAGRILAVNERKGRLYARTAVHVQLFFKIFTSVSPDTLDQTYLNYSRRLAFMVNQKT